MRQVYREMTSLICRHRKREARSGCWWRSRHCRRSATHANGFQAKRRMNTCRYGLPRASAKVCCMFPDRVHAYLIQRMSSPGTVFDIYLCDDAPGSSRWKDMLGEEYLRFHELYVRSRQQGVMTRWGIGLITYFESGRGIPDTVGRADS